MPRSVFVAMLSLPSSIFLTRTIGIVKVCWSLTFGLRPLVLLLLVNVSLLIKDLRPKTNDACVAEQQKHLTVNQESRVAIVGASPTACTKALPIADCRLPIGPSPKTKVQTPSPNRQSAIGNQKCLEG